MEAGGLLPPPGMGELLPPKRQAVVDRLRRRIEQYRRRQTDLVPKFDQTFHGLCEQNLQDTLMLKQRFLDNKTKRQPKKAEKKQNDNSPGQLGLSSIHVVLPKRQGKLKYLNPCKALLSKNELGGGPLHPSFYK
ncbi:hypothetical protein QAD02_009467 [Eretmocerus hayati]|uniref:Uncharacterized protein n=1 Tax=Eretmocerus hayati TaxID=131215 RepID=A0ACC2NBU8_9HYME|nr:hypothetical protein QAD02_009467 [Eretmocerus hayati]